MQDKKAYIHTIIRSLLFMAVAAVTLIFGTVAWFASNKEVSGNNSSVTITAPKSIFIMKQESATREFLPNDTVSFGGKQLFPISA